MRNLIITTFFILCTALSAHAAHSAHAAEKVPSYINASVPHALLVGQGRMTYMMMAVCDARLYAPGGALTQERPLALSMTYLTNLKGRSIADKSIEEMRGQGFKDERKLALWHKAVRRIFPNVTQGTNLTGVLNKQGVTTFYRNGRAIGQVKDPDFGYRFFAIWLSPKSSNPDLRASLLNQKQPGI